VNKILCIVKNENGSVVLAIAAAAIVGILLFSSMTVLDSSRKSVNIEMMRDHRVRVLKKIKSFLASPYILDYSFNVQNSPDSNPALAACIQSAIPSAGCPSSITFDFYEPLAAGAAARIVGDTSNPVYTDLFGTNCETAEGCNFQVSKSCQFSCPAGQTVCPTLKVVLCDIEVKLVEQSFLRTIKFREMQGQFVTTCTVRLQKNALGENRYLVTLE